MNLSLVFFFSEWAVFVFLDPLQVSPLQGATELLFSKEKNYLRAQDRGMKLKFTVKGMIALNLQDIPIMDWEQHCLKCFSFL